MTKKEKPDELKDAELAMTPVKVKKTVRRLRSEVK